VRYGAHRDPEFRLRSSSARWLDGLILAARVAGSQLTDGAVYIGLTPEDVRPVVEDVEVVGVIAFLLDDLELDVLVVQVGIESL
jgi:hypothetical protein